MRRREEEWREGTSRGEEKRGEEEDSQSAEVRGHFMTRIAGKEE
jgi:hypothetical protein